METAWYRSLTARVAPSKKTLPPLARRKERWFYLLISPWLVGLFIFQVGPILFAFGLSFVEWPLPQSPQYVGLMNFRTLLADSLFAKTIANTAYYALGTVIPGIAVGLLLAILVRRPYPGITLFRAIFFLPAVMSGVALTLLWGWILNPQYGLVNELLAEIGLDGPGWLYDDKWAMPSLILMSLWTVGTNMLIYLAALHTLPGDLYEAAALDGAGRWQQFRNITWPLLSPVTFYLLVVNFIAAFQVFTPSYLLTRGGPNNATLTLPLYIYFNAFSWNKLGYASTLSLLLFLAVLAMTIVQFRFGRRWVFYRQP